MALGAGHRTVVRMVVASGLTHALIGSALGLLAALVATRTLNTVLYDVSAADPAMLTLATLTLLSVALVACWLPARRAAGVDPAIALRND